MGARAPALARHRGRAVRGSILLGAVKGSGGGPGGRSGVWTARKGSAVGGGAGAGWPGRGARGEDLLAFTLERAG